MSDSGKNNSNPFSFLDELNDKSRKQFAQQKIKEFITLLYDDYMVNHLNDMNREQAIDYILNKIGL